MVVFAGLNGEAHQAPVVFESSDFDAAVACHIPAVFRVPPQWCCALRSRDAAADVRDRAKPRRSGAMPSIVERQVQWPALHLQTGRLRWRSAHPSRRPVARARLWRPTLAPDPGARKPAPRPCPGEGQQGSSPRDHPGPLAPCQGRRRNRRWGWHGKAAPPVVKLPPPPPAAPATRLRQPAAIRRNPSRPRPGSHRRAPGRPAGRSAPRRRRRAAWAVI